MFPQNNKTQQRKIQMNSTVDQLKTQYEEFLKEDTKFIEGNAAAGTRARKALAEMSKLIKARRNEITAEKNARKQAKAA
jgi:uncharacterized protein YbaP (TraB family)